MERLLYVVPVNHVSSSDDVQSRCWLLYVLDGCCAATGTTCCWLALCMCVRSPLRRSAPEDNMSPYSFGLTYTGFIDAFLQRQKVSHCSSQPSAGLSHKSHSVLLWELTGKLGTALGRSLWLEDAASDWLHWPNNNRGHILTGLIQSCRQRRACALKYFSS